MESVFKEVNLQDEDYNSIIEKYDLSYLQKNSGDFSVSESGGLKFGSDGEIQVGDVKYNALSRLVRRWSMEAQTLKNVFESIIRISSEITLTEEKRNCIFNNTGGIKDQSYQFREAQNKSWKLKSSVNLLSSMLFLVLNNMLQRFKKDMGIVSENKIWDNGSASDPLFGACSIAEIIRAASNNFRHYDEWASAKEEKLTPKQKSSINVIKEILKLENMPRENVSHKILEIISENSFEKLCVSFFAFVKDIADSLILTARDPNVNKST